MSSLELQIRGGSVTLYSYPNGIAHSCYILTIRAQQGICLAPGICNRHEVLRDESEQIVIRDE